MISKTFLLIALVIVTGSTGATDDCTTGTDVCQHGGVCPSNSQPPCNCKDGYSGAKCETAPTTCTGTSESECNFQAKCTGSCCVCLGGYTGNNCETAPGTGACQGKPCGDHGTCLLDESNNKKPKCRCRDNYYGDTCTDAPTTCTGKSESECNFQAKCTGSSCVCLGGYTGNKCETAPGTGACQGKPCGDHGTCSLDESDSKQPKCRCRDNYYGDTCTDAPASSKGNTETTPASDLPTSATTTTPSKGTRQSGTPVLIVEFLTSALLLAFV